MARNLKKAIRSIPDFPKPGIVFRDITTLMADTEAFRHALDLFQEYFHSRGVTKIAAVDSRGFIFGGALADRMGVPLVPVRKKGKLPHTTIGQE
jgi:adenine phosphoribosyltransferase